MNSNYYEDQEDEIVKSYNGGEITLSQMEKEMRDLRREIQQEAEEAARDAYNEVISRY